MIIIGNADIYSCIHLLFLNSYSNANHMKINFTLTPNRYTVLAGWMAKGIMHLCLFLVCLAAMAQSKDRALTLDEYTKTKTFRIENPEQDTYVKVENTYVLDRYEMKPPYVFKYSDGIERRIYLYRLLDNKTKSSLGLVAMYTTPSNGKVINICVPNALADKAVWAAYIDDLKENGAKEAGLLSTFSYVLSREMSSLFSGGGAQSTTAAGAKTDYDVCFPADALVTMADGSERKISEVKAGDQVASYNTAHPKLEATQVLTVEVHENKDYAITTLTLIREEILTASIFRGIIQSTTYLEATDNHPVLTKEGRKEVGKIREGEKLFCYDNAAGEFVEYTVQKVAKGQKKVSKVYNLVTKKQNYVVNQAVVLDK